MSDMYVNCILTIVSDEDALSLTWLKQRLYETLQDATDAMPFGAQRAQIREASERIIDQGAGWHAVISQAMQLVQVIG